MMQTYLFILAALLYFGCALLPSKQRKTISAIVAAGWLVHGGALWADVVGPEEVRVGFSMMLSATLWVSVAAYWLENRNYTLDGLRMLVVSVEAVAVIWPAVFP